MTTPIFPQVDPSTGALPALTESRYLSATAKGVPSGVAALNGSGVPVTAAGVPVAVIGTVSGTAADAAVVAGQISTVQGAVSSATTAAASATTAATSATSAATTATTAANAAVTATANKVGTGTDASRVPEVRWYATKPTIAALTAANVPVGTIVLVTATA